MSLISQIAVVVLILMIAVIITYANKGLEKAEKEGERFVDEWVLKQQRQEKQKNQLESKMKETQKKSEEEKASDTDNKLEKMSDVKDVVKKRDNVIPLRSNNRRMITLTVVDEQKNAWKKAEVDHYPFLIGRGSDNDLIIEDLYVARKHCEIVEENGAIVLRDKGSSNKFYAQGRQLNELILCDKIRFYIGNYEFIVEEHRMKDNPTILANRMEKISV